MAENSENSAKAGKPRTIKTPRGALAVPVIQPAEAVEIAQSALAYCRQAGLVVRLLNNGTELIVVIGGVQYDAETADLRLVAPEAAPPP